jgi:F-type H+-transporting ATPase subunit delta
MIRAASRHAMVQLRARLDDETAGASTDDLSGLAREIYSVAGLLVDEPRLRRTVGDPSTAEDLRSGLVGRLFEGKIGERALKIVQAAVELRWSSPWDLTDGLELAGDDVLLRAAEQGGNLDEVEDELFRFERVLDAEPELTTLLDEATASPERRGALLRDVVFGRVHPITQALLEHAVASSRKRSVERVIDDLLEAAAARKARSVARVISAVPVTPQQEERLVALLSDLYHRPIEVRAAVDPAVQGGLLIRIGDEVIDGSVASRFSAVRTELAGK